MTWLFRTAKIFAFVLAYSSFAYSLRAQSTAMAQGLKFFREEQFEHALEKFEQVHHAEPQNATIDNLLGITETRLGHLEKADSHYREAIRLQPRQAAPHRNLGFNLLNENNYVRAEPELLEASRLEPEDKFAHYYLFLLAVATSRDTDAVAQATRASALIENDPEAYAGLIEADIRTGRLGAASEGIDRMEKTSQLTTAREYQIAVLLSQHSLQTQAVHCFRRIALLDPSWESRYNLALALLYGGKSEEASTLLASLHLERPVNADVLMFLGAALEAQHKMPESLEAYRAAVAADPANPDRTLDYTRLLMDMDRYDEAIQAVQTDLGKTSAAAPLEVRLGAVEMLKSNFSAARDAFHTALASNPELDAAYIGLAQSYSQQGNDDEAISILQGACDKLPDHYLLEYYLGLTASRLGQQKKALDALEKAVSLEPKSPEPLYELGKLYVEQQDWLQARQSLERVIQLNPQFARAHYQLSRVYVHLGLNVEAGREAQQTHALMDTQREEALRRQREWAGSFQPQVTTTPSP